MRMEGFPAERMQFFQAPIKLAQPFPNGPRIAGKTILGHEDFSDKKFLPVTGAAGKPTFWGGRPRFSARTSMI